MSAFGGVCSWDGRPISADRLSVMADFLCVAGPDDTVTTQPEAWLAMQAHLLHFDRLSASEKQPYRLASGSLLTWDGRLDNREDLLISLHRVVGPEPSDVELVSASFDRWGIEAIPRLIGDWCLAMWDYQRQRVILARDYIGNRPLYYRAEPDRLAWATRLEAIAASERLFEAPDDTYIAGFLTDIGTPDDATPFVGVVRLLAGHILIASRDNTVVRRYWTYSAAPLRYRGLDQYAEHLRLLVTEAVKCRLRATRTVWAHLSGGWDSSTVVCMAHRLVERRRVETPKVQPLSMIADDPEAHDERLFISAVEQWCDLKTIGRPYLGRPSFDDRLGYRTLVPAHDMFDLEAPVQDAGDHVVLSGSLGDLTMGYDREGGEYLALWEPFDEGHPVVGLRNLLTYARATQYPVVRLFLGAVQHRVLSETTLRKQLRTRRLRNTSSRDGVAPELVLRALERHRPTQPVLNDFARTRRSLVDALYKWGDRDALSSPEHHVPTIWRTHPYTHRPLIEFLLAVPSLSLFDPLFARAGMRRAMADVLPPAILQRGTKVGIVPTALDRATRRYAECLRSAQVLREPLAEWRLVQRGIVDVKRLAHDVRVVHAGYKPTKFLHQCLSIEAWLRSILSSSGKCSGRAARYMSVPRPKRTLEAVVQSPL